MRPPIYSYYREIILKYAFKQQHRKEGEHLNMEFPDFKKTVLIPPPFF